MVIYEDSVFLRHETGRHPENAGRLNAISERLRQAEIANLTWRPAGVPVARNLIEQVHSPELVERIEHLAQTGGGAIDADTVVSPASFEVAIKAAGTVCAAVKQVMTEADSRAMCLIRPPGHHATSGQAMGFCLFNHIAIAARYAQQEYDLERVLIVDWDVHHGNGTQEIFYSDESVGFFSIHRFPFYPGSGDWEETGTGRGLGTTWNVPVKFGITPDVFVQRFERTLEAALNQMKPQFILLSAGFDAHRLDPVGSLGLESEDFARLSRIVIDAANTVCQGRIVSVLEGGYHPQALAESVEAHVTEMAN